MEAWSSLGSFLIGCAALVVLVCYTIETRKLRKAAFAQVESMAKPCLTLLGTLRDPGDAIIGKDSAIGAMVVRTLDGQFVVHNIGNGLALNVTYVISDRERPKRRKDPGYLAYVRERGRTQLPEPINAYGPEFEATFQYKSIGGRRYKSVITTSHRVLTNFSFTEGGDGGR